MKKNLNQLLIASALLFISFNLSAQSDTTLDLGRVRIRKDFTQSITIKGKDLEKIPFASLTDVIAPWLEGSLTSRTNLIFVVDGNLVNDANAWSIYDIEEITLVQNALVQVNGAAKQQQLVLVKTKRQSESKGLIIGGSSALVKNSYPPPQDGLESETNFYHQYHVSAWQNLKNISYGISANFLRDTDPLSKQQTSETKSPPHLKRYRFNGYIDLRLAEGHSITARMNYVPQSNGYEFSDPSQFGMTEQYYRKKQSLLNPSIKLTNRIAPGLTNEFDVSYMSTRNPFDSRYIQNYSPSPVPYSVMRSEYAGHMKIKTFLIREQIGYSKKLGDWLIEPSLNFTYRSVKQNSALNFNTWYDNVPSGGGYSISSMKAESYVLTPAFSLVYKNSFNVIAGLSASLTDDPKPTGDGVFPFASLSLDLLRIGDSDNKNSLKIFGSYAKSPDFGDWYFPQDDLNYQTNPTPVGPVFGPVYLSQPYPVDAARRSIRAGAGFALAGNQLQINYSFEDRRYPDYRVYQVPFGPNGSALVLSWPDLTYTSHRLAVTGRVIDRADLQWLTGFNVTTFKTTLKESPNGPAGPFEQVNNNDKRPWTGGWTNRLQWKSFVMGIDVFYLFNEQRNMMPGYEKMNSWVLNNLYAGFKLKVANNRPLEIYGCARDIANNEDASYYNNRRYYGAGFKLQF